MPGIVPQGEVPFGAEAAGVAQVAPRISARSPATSGALPNSPGFGPLATANSQLAVFDTMVPPPGRPKYVACP